MDAYANFRFGIPWININTNATATAELFQYKDSNELFNEFMTPIMNKLKRTFANDENIITANKFAYKLLLSYLPRYAYYCIFNREGFARIKDHMNKINLKSISDINIKCIKILSQQRDALVLDKALSKIKLEFLSKKKEIATLMIDTLKDLDFKNLNKTHALFIILAENVLLMRFHYTTLETPKIISSMNAEIEQFLRAAYPQNE